MKHSSKAHNHIVFLWYLLKIVYGLFLIVVGLDKFFDLIVAWHQYVHPSILSFVTYNFLVVSVALLEMFLGVLVLSRWVVIGCYGSILWMAIVIIDLLALGFIDIAARDVLIALGFFTIALLTFIKDELE